VTDTVQRIGVFGGTFDPIHFAHLRCAEEVREGLGLDGILFVPAARPPHKRRGDISPAHHRLAMVRLAVRGHRAFRVSDIEVARSGPSYSIDTLRALRARARRATRFTLIVGADAFLEIGTWHQYEQIFALADLAVMKRPTFRLRSLRAALPVAARRAFCYSPDRSHLIHETGNEIHFLNVTGLDISASNIRQRVRRGQSVSFLTPRSVERYLHRHRLYQRGSKSF